MQHFKLNFKVILISFLFFNVCLAFFLEYYGSLYPSLPCKVLVNHKPNFSMVSKDFWDAICENGNVFVSSSEGVGFDDFQNIFNEKYNLKFEAFSGQHRGLKTAAYLVSHDLNLDRRKKMKLIVLVNPVYWLNSFAEIDDGAAHQSALSYFSYAKRVHLPQHWLSLFGNMALTSKEYLQNYYPLNFLNQSFAVLKLPENKDNSNSYEPISLVDEDSDSEDIRSQKELFRSNYDLERGMTKEFVSQAGNVPYSWHFEKNVEPMTSILEFFRLRTEELQIQYCLVLLPLNEKYLQGGMKNLAAEKVNIRSHYANFPQSNLVDLMDLGRREYLFKDIMHFTRFGRRTISEALKKSDCFQKVYGTR